MPYIPITLLCQVVVTKFLYMVYLRYLHVCCYIFDNIIVNFSIIINVISSNSGTKWGKIQNYMHPSNMKWKQGEIKANKFISWVLNFKISRSQVGKKMLHFLYKYTFALNIHRTSIVYALFTAQYTKNMKWNSNYWIQIHDW